MKKCYRNVHYKPLPKVKCLDPVCKLWFYIRFNSISPPVSHRIFEVVISLGECCKQDRDLREYLQGNVKNMLAGQSCNMLLAGQSCNHELAGIAYIVLELIVTIGKLYEIIM